ncbi:hypothetical protein [Methylocystis sp. SC2]|uniref:hypothetical protein n=1 Tax=Methylocystis sp. (strain SC2) TaxID=187303 RepID=UPI00027AF4FC|nr:hypothetical protein [Methylocystis sp. SC2]CCJ08456.1 Hypothetical protein BN69_3005 [Methylocystis sp. SC2]
MYQPRHPSFSLSRSAFGRTLEDPAPRGQALQSLAETDSLRGRFFSWRGASGRRYVCSVFQAGEDSFVADVTNGVVIGVAREGAATRPVCVFLAQERVAGDRQALRRMARELGVAEWHVHFCADAASLRDLSASLLN